MQKVNEHFCHWKQFLSAFILGYGFVEYEESRDAGKFVKNESF